MNTTEKTTPAPIDSKISGISIAGRTINDGIDFYQTPSWVTNKLLEIGDVQTYLNNKTVLEPCSGAGAISKILINKLPNCTVYSSDIREDDMVFGEKGKNIFDYAPNMYDCIITNPPYCIAQKVIEHSLLVAKKKVFMLLKLQFLEGVSRYTFFTESPLKNVYVFCRRITMFPDGTPEPKNSGTIAYAWYEWEHGYTGNPNIKWIL